MVYKQTDYTIGDEHINFPSEVETTRVFSDDRAEEGNLGDLLFKGVEASGVDIASIKIAGVYNVKDLKGLPDSIPVDETGVLQVSTVGPIGQPTMVKYTYIAATGQIVNLISDGTKITSTSDAGTLVTNQMKAISAKIDDTNETVASIKSVVESGAQMDNGAKLSAADPDGASVDIAGVDDKGVVQVGDAKYPINVNSSKKGFTLNGKQVWTAENMGFGSGLDADKLDGIDGTSYALKDQTNEFKADQHFYDKVGVYGMNSEIDFGVGIGDPDFRIATHGGIQMQIGPVHSEPVRIGLDGTLTSNKMETLPGGLSIKENASDAGMKIVRTYNNELTFSDFSTTGAGKVFTIHGASGMVESSGPLVIQGRRLYLQGYRPNDSDIPVGSIWLGG